MGENGHVGDGWLSPFTVPLERSQHCLLTGHTPVQKGKKNTCTSWARLSVPVLWLFLGFECGDKVRSEVPKELFLREGMGAETSLPPKGERMAIHPN